MSDVRTEEFSEPRLNINLRVSDEARGKQDAGAHQQPLSDEASRRKSTDERLDAQSNDVGPDLSRTADSERLRRQNRLPALDDDAELGVQKEHIVTRDGKADLRFSGALLASAAPDSASKGHWQEYRIYRTNGDKHVFSRITRTVEDDDGDTYEAEVFDPAPSSVPSQLMRSAREIARARPLTWMDAAVAFFGYDPLAKVLYRKLSVRFEEQIS